MDQRINRALGLLEQAEYLESPFRRSGPSVEEGREAARAMRREADELLDDAFYFPRGPRFARPDNKS